MMSDSIELSLKHFYIHNECYGKVEGEEEQKIMYYYPPNVSSDEKIKNVGLSEAIAQFTESFSQQECESLHTLKTRHYYYRPEPHFCMVMVVNVPSTTRFQGEQVQDSVCQAVLKQMYLMYRLFNNTFTSTLADGDPTALKRQMEAFFNRCLTGLRLHNCDIMDVFQGVQFLPLDKQTFLHIQCFVNLLEATFPVVHFTAFLYKDKLIWSGLEPDDMQVVFHYLVYNLLASPAEEEQPRSSYGRFLTGPEKVHLNSTGVGNVPKLFLSHVRPSPATFHTVVYRASNCTVCLFIPESEQLMMEMFRKWDTFLGPRLTKLDSEVSAYTARQTSASPGGSVARFVYFNRMNLATKSTVHRSGITDLTPQVLRVLVDINADHARMIKPDNYSAETIIKTTTDYWVVGKLSSAREFYVIIQQKNANLLEINDEVKRVCDNELKSIFFHV